MTECPRDCKGRCLVLTLFTPTYTGCLYESKGSCQVQTCLNYPDCQLMEPRWVLGSHSDYCRSCYVELGGTITNAEHDSYIRRRST